MTADAVHAAGLVLTASKVERAAVARLDPSARARTFTLREAAALADSPWLDDAGIAEDLGPLERFAATIHAQRGLIAPPPRAEQTGLRRLLRRRPAGDPLDIVDGHGLDVRSHDLALDEVEAATDRILRALRARVA